MGWQRGGGKQKRRETAPFHLVMGVREAFAMCSVKEIQPASLGVGVIMVTTHQSTNEICG